VSLVKNVPGVGITTGTYNYMYDYRTRRILRDESSASGATTKLVFSGGLSVQEYAMSGTSPALTVEYVRGSDYGGGVGGILYTLRSGSPSYTHENHRGDVIAKTDGTGSLTYQAAYEAFGKRTQEQGSTPDRQKANTKEEDPTGLKNEGRRYLDLDTGTFLTADPAGMVDGPNLYAYVRQNPWTSFDPEGLSLKTWIQDKLNAFIQHNIQQETERLTSECKQYESEYAFYGSHYGVAVAKNDPVYNLIASGYEAKTGFGVHPENAGKDLSGFERFGSGVSAFGSGVETFGIATFGAKAITGAFSLKTGVADNSASLTSEKNDVKLRPADEQPVGGNGNILRDGEGATPAEISASTGGPNGGSRDGQGKIRAKLVDEQLTDKGLLKCWRCGATSDNPDDFHLGHRNVPLSLGGNLSPENVTLEGAACNLSAGNRGAPSPGMSCTERGGPGAPYGRTQSSEAQSPDKQ